MTKAARAVLLKLTHMVSASVAKGEISREEYRPVIRQAVTVLERKTR
jgi:hypothetical protein